MSLPESIDARVRAAIPGPQIVLGTVASIDRRSVRIEGLADEPIPCDWSPVFAAEIEAKGYLLHGAKVEVHYVAGSDGTSQPVIAYSIVTGAK